MRALRYFLEVTLLVTSTFCCAQTGPAGVGSNDGSSNLSYWIDAERGRTGTAPVTAVADLSGNNVTNTVNGNPSFVANGLNARGVLRFDGNDDIATNFSINAATYPDITVFAVHVPRVMQAGSVWGEDNGGWDRFMTDISLAAPLLSASVGAGYDHGATNPQCYNIPGLFSAGVGTLSNVIYVEDVVNATVVRVNGATVRAFTSTADNYFFGGEDGYSDFYVGAIGSNGFRFDGDIAEVIVFDEAISLTEQLIVENYLSAKYNIALSANDIYIGDNFGFDFDVAGIGMTGGIAHTDARGTGIVQISAANNLDADEFLMWGHNNGVLSATNTDVPASMDTRSNRLWFVSERNLAGAAVNVGSISISFDLTGLGPVTTNQLRLLVDTDGDGVFADETPRAGAMSLGSNLYAFNNVMTIENGVTFTIGTTNSVQTPLPVEVVGFYAEINQPENTIFLSWTTSSEKNNDRFEVARSANARDWSTLGSVEGNGNTPDVSYYGYLDLNPLHGRSYYRLCQFDYNGEETLSEIIAVFLDDAYVLSVFPNPAEEIVTISGRNLMLPIQIFNFSGLNVTEQVHALLRTDGAIEVDVRALPQGEYILICSGGRGKLVKAGK